MTAPRVTVADLKPRQLAVAAGVARALTDKQIAAEIGLRERMVRVHITAIAFLIGADPARNVRVQIALWYRSHENVPIPGVVDPAPLEAIARADAAEVAVLPNSVMVNSLQLS